MTSSESDGEALVAARLACKLVAESEETWENLLHHKKEYKKGYSAGYRAGYKKATNNEERDERKDWSAMRTRHHRRPPANMVTNRKKVVGVFEDLYTVWEQLSHQEKYTITQVADFYKVNQCLYLNDYDALMSIAKKYWGVYEI